MLTMAYSITLRVFVIKLILTNTANTNEYSQILLIFVQALAYFKCIIHTVLHKYRHILICSSIPTQTNIHLRTQHTLTNKI